MIHIYVEHCIMKKNTSNNTINDNMLALQYN